MKEIKKEKARTSKTRKKETEKDFLNLIRAEAMKILPNRHFKK
jgi:hypothetical protein